MEKVGVEAIVTGLNSFLGDMGKMDRSIKSLIPSNSLLGRAFQGVGNIVEWLTGSVFRVLEYTLGSLLASAIQKVVGWLSDMVAGVFESADSFAKLEVRLKRLNFNSAIESGKDYNAAMEEAAQLTKEQIAWATRLAALTPYDAKDVANVFTLARGYDFSADEAKSLTDAVVNFTAGMGLSNVEMERVIINFGQMRQQGKLNGQDLKDMARGAFVPVNKVLEITAEKLGMTTEEFNKLRSRGALSAEAVDVFRESFEDLVGVRFEGAAEAMGSIFSVASENIKGMIRDLLGMNIVMPVMNMLGGKMQEITQAIASSDERWNSLTTSMTRIGETLTGIVSDIMGVAPSAESVADTIVGGLDKIADWLDEHRDDIVKWVQKSADWLKNELIPKIIELKDWLFGDEGKEGAIQKFLTWMQMDVFPFLEREILPVLQDISDLIFGKKEDGDLATSINEINGTALQNVLYILVSLKPLLKPIEDLFFAIADVIVTAFGGEEPKSFADFVTNTLVPAIQDLTKWIEDNRENLALAVQLFIALEVIGTIVGVVLSLVVKGFILLTTVLAPVVVLLTGVVRFVGLLYTAFNWLSALLMTSVSAAFGIFLVAIVGIILQLKVLEFGFRSLIGGVKIMANAVVQWFTLIKANVVKTITDAVNAIRNGDWLGAGAAIIQGMYRGIIINANLIISTLVNLAKNALDAAKKTLGIRSPSTEFFAIGEQLMQGFASGITATADLAAKAMQGATAATVAIGATAPSRLASVMAPGSVSNTTNNNLTLNMQSSAPTENIIQDFEMMRSMVT